MPEVNTDPHQVLLSINQIIELCFLPFVIMSAVRKGGDIEMSTKKLVTLQYLQTRGIGSAAYKVIAEFADETFDHPWILRMIERAPDD